MRQRGDHECFHEPFHDAWYHGPERLVPASRETEVRSRNPLRPDRTFRRVFDELREAAARGPVFSKDFPRYVSHMIDDQFLDAFVHTFLIRTPAKVLPSLYHHWSDIELAETGFVDQRAMFEIVLQRTGEIPPVVDSDDLPADPAGVTRAYCDSVGIPFVAEALGWGRGDQSRYSSYDGGSWHGKLARSSSLAPQPRDYVDIEHDELLSRLHRVCLPHYERLHGHRLSAVPPDGGVDDAPGAGADR